VFDMTIGHPTNVRGGASPIFHIDQLARAGVDWPSASTAAKCDAVFRAFIQTFREQHWKYTAGGAPIGVAHLLGGVVTAQMLEQQFPGVGASLDCGRLRNMLKLAMDAIVGANIGFRAIDVTGYFLTRKLGTPPPGVVGSFDCIDRNVYGNVRTSRTAFQMEQRCLFLNHYALEVTGAGKIYDACLTSTYTNVDMIIEMRLKQATAGDGSVLVQDTVGGAAAPGGHAPARFQALPGEQPTGFSAGYMWQ
jgi:hypothetical protein